MDATLLLVDAFSHIYRSFHALPHLTAPDGQPVHAVLGFLRILQKLQREFRPTHVAAVFDLGPPRRRLELLPSYKEQRPPTPQELESQLPHIRRALALLGTPIVELEGEEADDVIATLACAAAREDARVLIATNDKDFAQLVGPQIRIVTSDGCIVDGARVRERYGVGPEQIVDFFSLVGDTSDNIAGVPGIGPKRAAELLQQYRSLDDMLRQVDQLPDAKWRTMIRTEAPRLLKNRELIQLRTDVPVPVGWRDLRPGAADREGLRDLYQSLGLRSLLKSLDTETLPSQKELF